MKDIISFFLSGSPTPGLNNQRKEYVHFCRFVVTADGNVTGKYRFKWWIISFGFFEDKMGCGGTQDVLMVSYREKWRDIIFWFL